MGGCTTANFFSTLPKDEENKPQSGDEADYVRDSITTFVQSTQSRRIIDYQMAVVKTDWFDTVYGHGQLRGPTPVIKSTSANPIGDFQNAINDIHMCARQPCSSSNGFEMGLNSARQAITDSGACFIRNQSNLLVIVVSDEQDSSCTPIPGDTAYFPIVCINRTDCSSFASPGSRYLEVLTGYGKGQAGSICQNAMQASLDRVASAVADNGICFPLRSQPAADTIELFVDGIKQSTGYGYDNNSNNLCFDINSIPPNRSSIEISYVVR